MGMGQAHQRGKGYARQIKIRDVLAISGQQPKIVFAPDRPADALARDGLTTHSAAPAVAFGSGYADANGSMDRNQSKDVSNP
jgi:hypothetical protein